MKNISYACLGVQLVMVAWLGIIWLVHHGGECDTVFISVVICQWNLTVSALVAIWPSYDEFS